ncbi:thymidylate kinase [Oscillospiraceae bacterium PP1C4]
MRGKLIVLDGLDGSGKQTQTKLLSERLLQKGEAVKAISFPDYAQPSSVLVRQYLAGDFGQADEVSAYAASSFYAVDRFASFNKFWQKDYLSGYTILADRYTTSNIVHQMTKLPRAQWESFITWLEDFEYVKLGLPRPDAVIYLDMHPDVSRELMLKRYGGDDSKRDIHEANLDYMMRCRDCALYVAEQFGWKLISCSDEHHAFDIEVIAEKIYETVKML